MNVIILEPDKGDAKAAQELFLGELNNKNMRVMRQEKPHPVV